MISGSCIKEQFHFESIIELGVTSVSFEIVTPNSNSQIREEFYESIDQIREEFYVSIDQIWIHIKKAPICISIPKSLKDLPRNGIGNEKSLIWYFDENDFLMTSK